MPKKVQIWPENGIFVHFGPGLASSFGALLVGWLVGGCGARAVSRKTPIYFIGLPLLNVVYPFSLKRKKTCKKFRFVRW